MSELFTITARHVLFFLWIVISSIPFLVKNENDYYTYFDRVVSWWIGVLVGVIGGVVIL